MEEKNFNSISIFIKYTNPLELSLLEPRVSNLDLHKEEEFCSCLPLLREHIKAQPTLRIESIFCFKDIHVDTEKLMWSG